MRSNSVLNIAAPGFLLGDTDADGDTVVATLITDNVDHGTLTAFPDGHFTYTPNTDFVGVDSFTYRISDGHGGTDEGVVTIDVTNTNPVADDESYDMRSNSVLNIAAPGFLLGDIDADGDTVVATLIADNVDHGTLTAFPDGHFTYTPNTDFVGVDSFTYRVSDGHGGTDEGVVTIHVTNTNPVADDDSYAVQTGHVLSIAAPGFLAGDTDADGDTVVATQIVDTVDHGTLSAFPDGHFTYTPNLGFVGVDSFIYRISDNHGGFDDATVSIQVTAANQIVTLGNAPVRETGTNKEWTLAWTNSHVGIVHKADYTNASEAYTSVKFTGALPNLLSGNDIYAGDLGVSGQSEATSSVRQEIDGKESLRFNLDQGAHELTLFLNRFFSQDDGSGFVESGRVRLLDASGTVVGEQVFRADNLAGTKQVTVNSTTAFTAVEINAGAYDGSNFKFGAYANPDGSFGALVTTDAGGVKHGSDFIVDAVEFQLPVLGVPL